MLLIPNPNSFILHIYFHYKNWRNGANIVQHAILCIEIRIDHWEIVYL